MRLHTKHISIKLLFFETQGVKSIRIQEIVVHLQSLFAEAAVLLSIPILANVPPVLPIFCCPVKVYLILDFTFLNMRCSTRGKNH